MSEKVDLTIVPHSDGLDEVVAYWRNFEPGKGSVVLTCWGSAWTCYFGGMMGQTIQQFFAGCGADYLVNKLGCTQHLKQSKRNDAYLARIIKAVQATLKANPEVAEAKDGK
jgi:hypothetical protein